MIATFLGPGAKEGAGSPMASCPIWGSLPAAPPFTMLPMKKKTPQPKSLGIPKGIPAHLRKALAEELQKMGTTYPEFIYGLDPPPTPDVVLTLASTWNSLTPAQKAAWDDYAAQENLRRGYEPSRN
jgi:hypothetical protein